VGPVTQFTRFRDIGGCKNASANRMGIAVVGGTASVSSDPARTTSPEILFQAILGRSGGLLFGRHVARSWHSRAGTATRGRTQGGPPASLPYFASVALLSAARNLAQRRRRFPEASRCSGWLGSCPMCEGCSRRCSTSWLQHGEKNES
jgi:hypothetical protein